MDGGIHVLDDRTSHRVVATAHGLGWGLGDPGLHRDAGHRVRVGRQRP
ncbi:MAG: hypothetical protein UR53_C0001G0094 [Candidatus Magasanikbacteria bacterium GW2011_GWC2_34_16]|uniref:Uncharacterized protein n=2 Tax=Candidatus Magasanikiibacteriota TaxID=1752731 RepID=A0A0G0KKJ5_9BACT|nr:MAG: hypothetical protein UR53_C0001G0094 [Candidatus Magasanikbacteria bacterium GW2011_GWC2_34_16]KKQ41096.1 MAG: hypothetical protein US58_C0005G0021 [Candidatus Magasanikbacteria bacterium GW2011_GWA2_37_8]